MKNNIKQLVIYNLINILYVYIPFMIFYLFFRINFNSNNINEFMILVSIVFLISVFMFFSRSLSKYFLISRKSFFYSSVIFSLILGFLTGIIFLGFSFKIKTIYQVFFDDNIFKNIIHTLSLSFTFSTLGLLLGVFALKFNLKKFMISLLIFILILTLFIILESFEVFRLFTFFYNLFKSNSLYLYIFYEIIIITNIIVSYKLFLGGKHEKFNSF